jgi:hypothetical protein
MKSSLALGAFAGLLLLAAPAARAEDIPYAPWQAQVQTGTMPELVKNLRTLIDKAERDKAANPLFLKDLRSLADQYGGAVAGWPVKLLYDDFQDGQYTSNPAWSVTAGEWQVANVGGTPALFSQVRLPNASGQSSNKASDVLLSALGAVLNQQNDQNQQSNQSQQGQNPRATILTPVAITDQFSIKLVMISGGERVGQFNFGPFAGKRTDSSYQITYEPGAARGLVLSRITDRSVQTLASSSGSVDLEDGKNHVVEWNRGPGGKMTVNLDGKLVLQATDVGGHKPFTGFVMVNSGGSYGVRSVTINGVKQ